MKKQTPKYTFEDFLKNQNFENIFRELEDRRVEKNIEIIDENLKYLAEYVGRELTDYEENFILDIIDEYTPKDANGNYLIDILPLDYAWEIYQAKRAIALERFCKLWKGN